MARYSFNGKEVRFYLPHDDADLVQSLVTQMIELLSEDLPEQAADPADPADPFALWEADLAADPDEPEAHEDPAVARLFPNPYPHDPEAASDYRRFAESDHRRRKIRDAEIVRKALDHEPLVIPVGDVDAWLKTLNALRLVLATRLGVDDEDSMDELAALSDNDPRAMMASVMDYLGWLQQLLIELVYG